MEENIIKSFDIWTEAKGIKSKGRVKNIENISFEGIAHLRGFILELAIRGKLVPQNPTDEPASQLVKKITIEKDYLTRNGKIKKEKPLLVITEKEKPFRLPKNWEWVRLGTITNKIGSGSTPRGGSNVYTNSGVIFLRSQNIRNEGLLLDDVAYINDVTNNKMSNTVVEVDDILLNITGGSLGRCAIFTEKMMRANISQHVSIIRPTIKESSKYLHNCILSPYVQNLIWRRQVGANREGLSKRVLELFEIPLPPLAEQKRIVAKVDELMALCDELEKEQTNNLKTHHALVKAVLETLTQAKDADELQAAWQRMSTHFDTLFCTEDSIDQLKQTILQLAIMGRLVKQDPNDEPASELIHKIALEKLIQSKDGKVKGEKLKTQVRTGDVPFELPESWRWVALEAVSKQITDGEHITPPRINAGYKLLSAKNVRDGYIDYENCDHVSTEIYEKCIKRCKPEVGDLLIISVGGTIGRTSLVKHDIPFVIVRSVAMIKPILIDSDYLKIVMDSPLLQSIINKKSRGGAQPCLYLTEIKKFVFPVPPLAEQRRIASKVYEIFDICDHLTMKLSNAEGLKLSISKAVVEKCVA